MKWISIELYKWPKFVFHKASIGGSQAYPSNNGHEKGKHPEWYTSPSQGNLHWHFPIDWQFRVVNPPTGKYLGDGKKLENPKDTPADTEEQAKIAVKSGSKPCSASNRWPWSCEAWPCHPGIYYWQVHSRESTPLLLYTWKATKPKMTIFGFHSCTKVDAQIFTNSLNK